MRIIRLLVILVGLSLSAMATAQVIHVTDSRGAQTLPDYPKRPVVLDWSLVEQVIELGVSPVGAPELPAYADWVVQPAIPAGTRDVGTRTEPNLEQIAALHPDVILVSNVNAGLIEPLQKIAPVLVYRNFSADDDQARTAITQFRQLAQVFNRMAVANKKLEEMNALFVSLKHKLADAFHHQLPPVVVMRFASTTSAFIYSTNSIPVYVLHQLGLTNALPVPPAQWGIVQKPLSALATLNNADVLYFLPFNKEAQLKKSILWRAMPFVRNHRIQSVRPVWSYGGAMSLKYNAQAMTESLLKLAKNHE